MFSNLHKDALRESFLRYICRHWNQLHPKGAKISQVELEFRLFHQFENNTRSEPVRISAPPVQCNNFNRVVL